MLTEFGEVLPLSFSELSAALAAFDSPWWIAGGWAIDLYLGEQTREHDDVEISVLFSDQDALRSALNTWDLFVVADKGVLSPWRTGDRLELPRHQLWARRTAHDPWSLEILFERHVGDEWVFRRDERVRRPLRDLGRLGSQNLPIVVPEVELLFKAKNPRPKDEADFAAAFPALETTARAWLRSALVLIDDAHPWLAAWDLRMPS